MQRFGADHPRLTLDLTVDISLNLRAGLLERAVNLAFLMGPVSEFTVENVPLPSFDLTWFKSTSLGAVDLREVPVISYAARTRPYRELSEALMARHGPGLRLYTSASLSASLEMIAAGMAVGPYPRAVARPLLAAGRIEAFDPDVPCRPLAFTASYLAEPRVPLAERGARLAREIAEAWHRTDDGRSRFSI
jgi:DNA-binding transcriptional LysR family regulator